MELLLYLHKGPGLHPKVEYLALLLGKIADFPKALTLRPGEFRLDIHRRHLLALNSCPLGLALPALANCNLRH